MKLNLGCGKKRLPGYVGVDIVQREAVDVLAPLDKLPMADGSATEVLAVHVIEHFYPWEVPVVLAEWRRVLAPGGRLVLELPDVKKAAYNLVNDVRLGKNPDQAHMWAIFGDDTLRDPYMMHKSGWWPERLTPVVRAVGFDHIVACDTQFHPVGRRVRDFRLEAVRC